MQYANKFTYYNVVWLKFFFVCAFGDFECLVDVDHFKYHGILMIALLAFGFICCVLYLNSFGMWFIGFKESGGPNLHFKLILWGDWRLLKLWFHIKPENLIDSSNKFNKTSFMVQIKGF